MAAGVAATCGTVSPFVDNGSWQTGYHPADACPTHHQPGTSSNDPNTNTNPDGALSAADSVTTPCGYGNPCSVTIPLADAIATITAQDAGAPHTSAAFSEASVPRGGPVLFVTRDGGGAMPHCPGYQTTFTQWAQFGMYHADNGFRKSATFELRHPGPAAAARAAARRMQICFEAPYPFQNRPGYQVAEHDGVFDGVLPECSGFHDSAALPRPCVSDRGIVRHGSGWVARIQFRIPAGPQDPKALG
jgi:hypothetical protein